MTLKSYGKIYQNKLLCFVIFEGLTNATPILGKGEGEGGEGRGPEIENHLKWWWEKV